MLGVGPGTRAANIVIQASIGVFATARYTTAPSIVDALQAFMDKHGDAWKGKANLVVDVCTLFHLGVWYLPSDTLALVRAALLNPTDVDAAHRATRALYFTKKAGVLSTFLRTIGRKARDYFKVIFVFEHGAST